MGQTALGELAWWAGPTHTDLARNLEVKDNDFLLGFNFIQKKNSEVGSEFLNSKTRCLASRGAAPTPQPQRAC